MTITRRSGSPEETSWARVRGGSVFRSRVLAFAQVTDDFLDWGMVDPVARPDMMGDRPARDHHHADDHLHVPRLAVAAGAVLGELVRARALEVGTGDVVEHQLGLETEEVAEAVVERHFDPVLGRVELIEGAVPGVA